MPKPVDQSVASIRSTPQLNLYKIKNHTARTRTNNNDQEFNSWSCSKCGLLTTMIAGDDDDEK